MAGIYIHIPFCKKACHYCNFYFSISLKHKNEFISALLNEIVLQKKYLENEEVETIYFGGGTPSLLTEKEVDFIFQKLYSTYTISSSPEITLEANPDDINANKVKEWKHLGINRLSIGIQSFFEEDLQWMNRVHSSDQSLSAIKTAQDAGLQNLTIDLIYGTPLLTDAQWRNNIQHAVDLQVPHLSCYALTVEPKTALNHFIQNKTAPNINTDDQARQFLLSIDLLETAGYEHYEISNFARPGYRSRHNCSYWQGEKYLGLGPSAHSFNGYSRQWNVANTGLYIQQLKQNKIPFEQEMLSKTNQLNEYIMIALRTAEGIDTNYITTTFGKSYTEKLLFEIGKFMQYDKMIQEEGRLKLTKTGMLFADGIAAELFF